MSTTSVTTGCEIPRLRSSTLPFSTKRNGLGIANKHQSSCARSATSRTSTAPNRSFSSTAWIAILIGRSLCVSSEAARRSTQARWEFRDGSMPLQRDSLTGTWQSRPIFLTPSMALEQHLPSWLLMETSHKNRASTLEHRCVRSGQSMSLALSRTFSTEKLTSLAQPFTSFASDTPSCSAGIFRPRSDGSASSPVDQSDTASWPLRKHYASSPWRLMCESRLILCTGS